MIGERVAVLVRTPAGTDGMGEPVWEWERRLVDGVLVKPVSPDSGAAGALRPEGVRVSYTLAFPKSEHALLASMRGALVSLVDRGMPDGTDEGSRRAMLSVVGEPDYMSPCPTAWDSLVHVGRTDG